MLCASISSHQSCLIGKLIARLAEIKPWIKLSKLHSLLVTFLVIQLQTRQATKAEFEVIQHVLAAALAKQEHCKLAASIAAKVQHTSITMSYSSTSSPKATGTSSKLASCSSTTLFKFAENDTAHEERQLQQESCTNRSEIY